MRLHKNRLFLISIAFTFFFPSHSSPPSSHPPSSHPHSPHPHSSSPHPSLSLLLQLWLAGLWCTHVGEYPGYGEGGGLCSEGGQGGHPLSRRAGEDGGAYRLLPCVLSEDERRRGHHSCEIQQVCGGGEMVRTQHPLSFAHTLPTLHTHHTPIIHTPHTLSHVLFFVIDKETSLPC